MHINLSNIKLADNRPHFNRKIYIYTAIPLFIYICMYVMIWFNALEIRKRTSEKNISTLKICTLSVYCCLKNKTTIHFTVWPSIRPRSGCKKQQRCVCADDDSYDSRNSENFTISHVFLHGRDKLIYYALIDKYNIQQIQRSRFN